MVDIDDGEPGAEWHSGSGAPSRSLGRVGDFYFRTSNGYVYEKTGTSTWTFRRDITGPKGADATSSITAWYDQIRFSGWAALGANLGPTTGNADGKGATYRRFRGVFVDSVTFSDAVQADGSIHGTATVSVTASLDANFRTS